MLLANADLDFMPGLAVLLAVCAGLAYAAQKLGLVPIVGFLIAGTLCGPHALGVIHDEKLIDSLSEIGVILLLFAIGIEFSLEKLARIQRYIFLGGGLQTGLTIAVTAILLALAGVGWRDGVFTGCLVALSSTAVVMKILADRGETNSPAGQASLGILIFQDLAVVAMVLFVPMLGGKAGGLLDVVYALAKAVSLVGVVLIAARRVMPRLLELAARTCSPELFLFTVVAVCFGTAYLTSLAGVSLSLGAFLAGLVVSESRFAEHAFGEILPLRILFSAAFFVSVGMKLNLFALAGAPVLVGLAVLAVLLVKVLTTGLAVTALRLPWPAALTTGLLLAQVGEFAFVLETSGSANGLHPGGLARLVNADRPRLGNLGSTTFIAATVVLMILTPLMAQLAGWLDARLRGAASAAADAPAADADPHLAWRENHVIVAGYGDAARHLVRVLKDSGIPYVVTTLSPPGADEAEREGHPVLLGDSTRPLTLQRVGVAGAKMLVCADDDPATARRVAAVARTLNPTLRIVLRTRAVADVDPLLEAGADDVVPEELESLVQLFVLVLDGYLVGRDEIDRHVRALRADGYKAVRDEGHKAEPVVVCSALNQHCLDTRTIVLRAGTPAVGRTLGELELDARYGLKVLAVRRGDEVDPQPPADSRLEAGDRLSLEGRAAQFVAVAPLFRRPETDADGPPPAPHPQARPVPGPQELTEAEKASPRCEHTHLARRVTPATPGCAECLRTGQKWVHLRVCLTCGHVGCCDSSAGRHATAHFKTSGHPIMKTVEPGESWSWCFVDEKTL
jgi:CPA2 family monovalent cation:H+ antiporter-2